PDDPLNRAAKSLAEAFAGSIVDVDDSPPVTATITDTIEDVEEIEEISEETPEDEKLNIRSVPF
ncbi:MAG: hypothetical protein HC860_12070, partial [Alkalinema sp. RU_4_3]|nr:hypothetical protein [Alkalinema sp. RU_4_3]